MVNIDKIMGRLGNKMFIFAFAYAYAREHGIDYFFQDPKYFEKYSKEIKQLFGTGIAPIDQVGIHYRQGDYINNPFYVNLSKTSYYQDAMALFPQGTEFLVCSDNIENAKQFFVGKQFEFSEGNTEIEDMNLLASCKGLICANSSYSIWAGMLGNHSKKVIAPNYDKYYTDGSKTRTVLPKEFIQI